ncbi:putative Carbohydrate-binding family 6 protein [Blattamonas nauphoetae]|uniref:Carbohydrate-binding family 6 protein n=1 Tax=Blattamonas nauphoetae TaxID=2049346 RepID=A0ABQ9Y1A4_9EUKA|nr:putative Carbohydrate-binding family 6 protein [Blattamonas nauphoetae]
MILHVIFISNVLLCKPGDDVVPDKTILPACTLTNWVDSMIGWSTNRNFYVQSENIRHVGLDFYRTDGAWDRSLLSSDTFALHWGTQKCTDPKLWEVEPELTEDGVWKTSVTSYDKKELPFDLAVEYVFPQYQPFYLVRYTVTHRPESEAAGAVTGYLLDYTALSKTDGKTMKATTDNNVHRPIFHTQLGTATDPAFGSYAYDFSDSSSFHIGEVGGKDDPLTKFSADPKFSGKIGESVEGNQLASGVSFKFTLNKGESQTFSVIKGGRITHSRLLSALKTAISIPSATHFANGAKFTAEWLAESKFPKTLTPDGMKLYRNSLLFLKNGQNPSLGPIMASMHPGYAFRSWTRDAFFSAMVLKEAGHLNEALKFFEWMRKCELVDPPKPEPGKENIGAAFHTCYNTFTGENDQFVEPQYDSAGEFLVGCYSLSLVSTTRTIVKEWKDRIRTIEDFLLNEGHDGLILPDYSIWEESSNHTTGDWFYVGYFSFTQAMCGAGLKAAIKLEETLFHDLDRAAVLQARYDRLRKSILKNLVITRTEEDGTITGPYFARQIWSNTLEKQNWVDTSTLAMIYMGVITNQDKTEDGTPIAKSAYEVVKKFNTKSTFADKKIAGMARYEGDPYFYNSKWNPSGEVKETSDYSAPWGVTTMFSFWAEKELGERVDSQNRLEWMIRSSAKHFLPVGECVNHDGIPIWSSSPDIYEHGGVFIWASLLEEGMAHTPNLDSWNRE